MAKKNIDQYEDIRSNVVRKKKKKMKTKDKVIMVISIIVIIASLLTIAAVAFLNWKPISGGKLDSSGYTPPEIRGKSMNFLLCGIDYEEGTSRGHLTDVIMLVNFDIAANKVNILQIPRDTYIGTDETSTGKINAVYGRSNNGGIKGLASIINSKLKLPVDQYATVTMTAFRKVVDGIGGVKMNVPQTITLEGVTIQKGEQVLNGVQAEKFVRKRKGTGLYATGSDTERVKMQRLFVAALANQMKKTSVTKLATVITSVIGDVTTDMAVKDVIGFAGMMQKVDLSKMKIEMLPGAGRTAPSGQSVYAVDKDATAALLNAKFRPYATQVSASELGVPQLANVTNENEDTGNDFGELTGGEVLPGRKSSSNSGS